MSDPITDEAVLAFSLVAGDKTANGSSNDLREKFIAAVLTTEEEALEGIRSRLREKDLFDDVRSALTSAIDDLISVDSEIAGHAFSSAVRRGGMTNNHDLDFLFVDGDEKVTLHVELKRGESIYDQPQFLSLYVSNREILREHVDNYAEFFFDHYFSRLQALTGCPTVAKSVYMAKVFSPSYSESPFDHLYGFVKASATNRSKMAELQHESIHSYLSHLMTLDTFGVNLPALQNRMYQQLPKRFLSWDPSARTFVWERFDRDGLTLTTKFSTLSKKSSQLTTVVIHTKTGQKLQMLLRWKNNPCVKGPAWQIRLTK